MPSLNDMPRYVSDSLAGLAWQFPSPNQISGRHLNWQLWLTLFVFLGVLYGFGDRPGVCPGVCPQLNNAVSFFALEKCCNICRKFIDCILPRFLCCPGNMRCDYQVRSVVVEKRIAIGRRFFR